MAPPPGAWAALPMRFAARKIRRYSVKPVALAIGVGIGVGIGLLIAPASGEQTRADIADKVTDFERQSP